MPVTSIIFDLGGVLLDWDVDAIIAPVFSDPETHAVVKRAVFDHPDWLALDQGTLTEEEAVPCFVERSGQSETAVRALMDQVRIGLAPKPESIALLRDLHERGVPLYCLSNMHEKNMAYLRQYRDFFDCFSGIVISAPLKMIKPEPGIYQHLIDTYHLDPEASLFIDDMQANVDGARAVGLQAIQFTTAADCRRQLDTLLSS
jgi:putative hydrolase of the HAD superfamily